jgi:hypothetical protein
MKKAEVRVVPHDGRDPGSSWDNPLVVVFPDVYDEAKIVNYIYDNLDIQINEVSQ